MYQLIQKYFIEKWMGTNDFFLLADTINSYIRPFFVAVTA